MPDTPEVIFRVHALKQMYERGISEVEVREVLEHGVPIEDDPRALPDPTRLLLGWVEKRPLHVVIACLEEPDRIVVITAYEPDLLRWEPGFRRRRKEP